MKGAHINSGLVGLRVYAGPRYESGNIEHPTSNAEHPMRGDARSANSFEKPNIVARRFLKLLFPPGNGVAEAFSRKIDEMAQNAGDFELFLDLPMPSKDF
jgi:hypothetical protein